MPATTTSGSSYSTSRSISSSPDPLYIKAKLDVPFAQLMRAAARGYGDVKDDAGILARQPIDHGENNSFGNAAGLRSATHRRRIGEKLDIPDSLIDFIEGGDAAFEQRAAILRGLDAVRTAVEQRYPECLFCIGKRSRNGRLGYRKSRCRLRHTAGVGHRQENFQLAKLKPAPRALMSIHWTVCPIISTHRHIKI